MCIAKPENNKTCVLRPTNTTCLRKPQLVPRARTILPAFPFRSLSHGATSAYHLDLCPPQHTCSGRCCKGSVRCRSQPGGARTGGAKCEATGEGSERCLRNRSRNSKRGIDTCKNKPWELRRSRWSLLCCEIRCGAGHERSTIRLKMSQIGNPGYNIGARHKKGDTNASSASCGGHPTGTRLCGK